jgi:hypothetical protein
MMHPPRSFALASEARVIITREAHMLPRDSDDLRIGSAEYQRVPQVEPDFLGYSLLAAIFAVGVVLATLFAVF